MKTIIRTLDFKTSNTLLGIKMFNNFISKLFQGLKKSLKIFDFLHQNLKYVLQWKLVLKQLKAQRKENENI